MTKTKIISLILKLIVVVSAILGTILSYLAGQNSFMGGSVVFMYFTIQSNILLALLCLVGGILMLMKKDLGKVGAILKLVGTVSITLTGFVFCFVLAPTMADKAWNFQNILTHVVVPVCSIADYFVIGKDYKYTKLDVIWITVPPLAYTVYAAIGYVCHLEFAKDTYYPYFFFNWGSEAGAIGFSSSLPFMGPVWWIIILLGFLLGIAYLYRYLLDKLNKRRNK